MCPGLMDYLEPESQQGQTIKSQVSMKLTLWKLILVLSTQFPETVSPFSRPIPALHPQHKSFQLNLNSLHLIFFFKETTWLLLQVFFQLVKQAICISKFLTFLINPTWDRWWLTKWMGNTIKEGWLSPMEELTFFRSNQKSIVPTDLSLILGIQSMDIKHCKMLQKFITINKLTKHLFTWISSASVSVTPSAQTPISFQCSSKRPEKSTCQRRTSTSPTE